jgi:hypothetical protein
VRTISTKFQANNPVIAFQFNYCKIDPTKYT